MLENQMKQFPWSEVSYQLIETGYVDWPARDMTVDSIKRVTDKIPDKELGTLLNRIGIIFAPADSGEISTKAFPGFEDPLQKGKLMIYIPSDIEKLREGQIDSAIAFIFARLLLSENANDGHASGPGIQEQIPSKVQEWGFNPNLEK
jgi:hypothetical protein